MQNVMMPRAMQLLDMPVESDRDQEIYLTNMLIEVARAVEAVTIVRALVEKYENEVVSGMRGQLQEKQDTIDDLLHDLDSITHGGSPFEASFLRMKWELDGRNEAVEIINNAQAVDAVKVVRCEDCKWLYDGEDMYCCTIHTGLALIKPDGSSFCSYGERRTDDGH